MLIRPVGFHTTYPSKPLIFGSQRRFTAEELAQAHAQMVEERELERKEGRAVLNYLGRYLRPENVKLQSRFDDGGEVFHGPAGDPFKSLDYKIVVWTYPSGPKRSDYVTVLKTVPGISLLSSAYCTAHRNESDAFKLDTSVVPELNHLSRKAYVGKFVLAKDPTFHFPDV